MEKDLLWDMKQVHITSRDGWRQWLAENHGKEKKGIWLVFCRKETGKPSLEYGAAVEEALCYGWIDSIVKRIDDVSYCRKFSPRKENSCWSSLNRQRAERTIQEGRMTPCGLAKIEAAKRLGTWEGGQRPVIQTEMPPDLSDALMENKRAKDFFDQLAPVCRKQFILWITH